MKLKEHAEHFAFYLGIKGSRTLRFLAEKAVDIRYCISGECARGEKGDLEFKEKLEQEKDEQSWNLIKTSG